MKIKSLRLYGSMGEYTKIRQLDDESNASQYIRKLILNDMSTNYIGKATILYDQSVAIVTMMIEQGDAKRIANQGKVVEALYELLLHSGEGDKQVENEIDKLFNDIIKRDSGDNIDEMLSSIYNI